MRKELYIDYIAYLVIATSPDVGMFPYQTISGHQLEKTNIIMLCAKNNSGIYLDPFHWRNGQSEEMFWRGCDFGGCLIQPQYPSGICLHAPIQVLINNTVKWQRAVY